MDNFDLTRVRKEREKEREREGWKKTYRDGRERNGRR